VVFVGDRKLELRDFPDPTQGPAMWCLHAHPGLCLATARAVRSRQLNCFGGKFLGVELRGVTRISEAVAQGVRTPAGERAGLRSGLGKTEKDLDVSYTAYFFAQRAWGSTLPPSRSSSR